MSSRSREILYDQEAAKAAAAGLGNLPICNICGFPIDGTRERWHESHDPILPRHAGGGVTGIAHARCNLRHNNEHDTPLFWRMKRIRQKHIGAYVPKGRRLPGGRDSKFKIKMDGTVVDRRTGGEDIMTTLTHVSDELDAATVERCARVAIRLNGWGSPPRPDIAEHIASAIRSLIPNSAGAPSASHCGSPGESDPAVTQDCAPAGTVSARDLAIWLRDFRCGPLPGATLKPVVEKDRQLARALLSQFDIRRK